MCVFVCRENAIKFNSYVILPSIDLSKFFSSKLRLVFICGVDGLLLSNLSVAPVWTLQGGQYKLRGIVSA